MKCHCRCTHYEDPRICRRTAMAIHPYPSIRERRALLAQRILVSGRHCLIPSGSCRQCSPNALFAKLEISRLSGGDRFLPARYTAYQPPPACGKQTPAPITADGFCPPDDLMFKVRAGQPISCRNGHIVGRFRNDVANGEPISPEDMALDFSERGVDTPGNDATGHVCARCKCSVTTYKGGAFQVHTAGRWIS
jgi:hypothetical protein